MLAFMLQKPISFTSFPCCVGFVYRFMNMLQVVFTVLSVSVAELQSHILVWHVYYILFSLLQWFVCAQIFLETMLSLLKNEEDKKIE